MIARAVRLGWIALSLVCVIGASTQASAQSAPGSAAAAASTEVGATDPSPAPPLLFPGSDRLRVGLDVMMGYGYDRANSQLGFESQGRVGYAIFTAEGRVNTRLSYFLSANPVNETSPLPGCTVAGYYYPNDPSVLFGPATTVPCNPGGHRRVDGYRGIALDVVPQQGALREAYFDVRLSRRLLARFGRTRLPIGFDWQEAGSFTAKDAPQIQRINAQADFGSLVTYVRGAAGRDLPAYSLALGVTQGGSNRWWDYDYYYFEDESLHENTSFAVLASGTVSPTAALEIRGTFQDGHTGSKVERLPNYWASKRNNQARIISVSYRPLPGVRVLAEQATYIWGPTATSAEMLGLPARPVRKAGWYVTASASRHLTGPVVIGASVSHERIDRADSLVRFMTTNNLLDVTSGRKDGMDVFRVYSDFGPGVRVGFYRTLDENPFPWLSGISPIEGPHAFSNANTNKWGVVTRVMVK